MAGQGAEARTGRIQQDAIKPAKPLRLLSRQSGGIGGQGVDALQAKAGGIDAHPAQAPFGAIHGPHLTLVAHELSEMGALATRGGAGIEDPLAGLGIEQQTHRLGGAVLHAPVTLGVAGQGAQLTTTAQQREAPGQIRQGGSLDPGGSEGRQSTRRRGAQQVEAQVEGGGLVAGQTEGLGIRPLQSQLSEPGGQGMAQAKAGGGVVGQGAQTIPGLRPGLRAPAPTGPQQAIGHRRQPAESAPFCQLHGGAHRRRGRHPAAEQQLVEPQVQQPAQLGRLAGGWHLAEGIEPGIEQAPLADGAVGKFGS